MQIDVKTHVGNTQYLFKIDDPKDMEALHKAIILGNPPSYCNVCNNNEHFKMDSNKDKDGNIYVNVVCVHKGCFAKSKLGQYKAGGYFWHKFEQYKGKGGDKPKSDKQEEVEWDKDE